MFIKNHERTAFVWGNEQISYEDLLRHVHFYTTRFDAEKTRKVAIFSANSPRWAYALYAAWESGCMAVPIDFMAPADEVAYILCDCKPEVVFCSQDTAEILHRAIEQADYLPEIIIMETLGDSAGNYPPHALAPPDPNRTAAIIYTSGTTGSPKGVMLSFDNLLANIEAVTDGIPIYTPYRSVMALLPFHHIFPLIGSLVAPLSVGAIVAFAPALTSEAIIGTLEKYGIGIVIGVPRLYAAIHKGIMNKINERFLTRTLFKTARMINSGAVSRAMFKKVHRKFGGKLDYMVCGGAKLDEDVARRLTKPWDLKCWKGLA